jgi:hypothetical protein
MANIIFNVSLFRLYVLCNLAIIFSLFHCSSVFAKNDVNPKTPEIKHVIYITLDGVRWRDIYLSHAYFPKLWHKYADKLMFYGLPNSNTTMEVSSIPLSLPSYQSQMSGAVQPCDGNECGRISVTTLPEHLIQTLHLNKKEVAIFASWPVIAHAIESIPGKTYSNVGNHPVYDPVTHQADETMAKLNHKQAVDQAYKPNRSDQYTFAQALHYLKKYQPRFLWISMVNADDEAHANHLHNYHHWLGFYDDALDELFTTLKTHKLDSNTMVIVTTDHGRGEGANWTTHGPDYPEAKRTFAFVMNGKLVPVSHQGNIYHYSTLSVRPSIELALIHSKRN